MSYNNRIENNNIYLQTILNTVKALPEESNGIDLPTLTNEATAADLTVGKQLIDSHGNIVIGTNPYEQTATTQAAAEQSNVIDEIEEVVESLPVAEGGTYNIVNIPVRVISYGETTEETYCSPTDVYYVNDQGIACAEHITEDTTISALEGSILVVHAPSASGIMGPQSLPNGPLLFTRDIDGYPIVVIKVQNAPYIQII